MAAEISLGASQLCEQRWGGGLWEGVACAQTPASLCLSPKVITKKSHVPTPKGRTHNLHAGPCRQWVKRLYRATCHRREVPHTPQAHPTDSTTTLYLQRLALGWFSQGQTDEVLLLREGQDTETQTKSVPQTLGLKPISESISPSVAQSH